MPSLLGRPPPYAGSGACACLRAGSLPTFSMLPRERSMRCLSRHSIFKNHKHAVAALAASQCTTLCMQCWDTAAAQPCQAHPWRAVHAGAIGRT